MRTKISFVSFILSLALIACTSEITVVPTKTAVQETLLPVPLVTVDQIPSSTITQQFDSSFDCTFPKNSQSIPAFLNGTLLTMNGSNNIELYNLSTNETITLGQVVIGTGVISNRQKVAYIDGDENQVSVVSSNGEILASVPAPENWVEIIDWPDSEHLIIGNMPYRSDGGWYPPSSTIILNIKNGQSIEMLPEYPDIYKYISGPPRMGNYSYSLTAYDPTLNRVIYPAGTSKIEYMVLWDVQKMQEITRFYNYYPYGEIAWNTDGTHFVISLPPYYETYSGETYRNVSDNLPYVGGNEIFLASQDGKSKRLTFWTTRKQTTIHSFSWSPNNQYVAFWLETGDEKPEWQLSILEITTGEITSYCIEDEGSLQIIWNSDSSSLISTISKDDSMNHESIFIDLQSNAAMIWSFENRMVVGWFEPNQ